MHLIRMWRALALTGALLLLSQAAGANHASLVVAVSPATTNAYGDVGTTMQFGADEPATLQFDWPSAWSVAIGPPADEEQVGTGTWTGRFVHLLCGQGNLNGTITWEATVDGGAPPNTTGQLTWTSAGIFNVQIYIVGNSFVIANMPTSTVCGSTSDGLITFAFDADLPSGTKWLRNPSTSGVHTFGLSYTDTNGGNHTGTTANVIVS